MQDVHQLATMLKELDDQLVTCMKCGMCQAVCPVFSETMREGDVTRGKLALLDHLANEMIEDPQGVQEQLNRCLLCGSCAAACPSGVKVMDIFLKARVVVNGYLGLSPAKRAIFRQVLTRPRLFHSLLKLGSKFQGILSKPVNDMMGASCARFTSPLGDRHFAPLAKSAFREQAAGMNTERGESGLKAAVFTGCLIDNIFPRVGEAMLKILERRGVGVWIPKDQVCCGIPAISSGDRQSFDKLVRENVEAYARGDFDYIVTACATCSATMHEIWPMFTDDMPADTAAKINELAGKTMDINAFLADKLGLEPPAEAGADARRVTYHDPCHLVKSQGVSAQPRAVLGMNPDYQLVEMNEHDRCCGNGGSFNLNYYEMSKKIGERKRDNILASGAHTIATGCPACMMQITDLLSQAGENLEVRHPVEIYAERLK